MLTSWSLRPKDKASFLVRFLNEQQLALEDLAQVPFVSPSERQQHVQRAAVELVDSQLLQTKLGHVERSLAELSRVAEQMAKLPPNQPDRDLEASWKQQLDILRDETQKVSEQLKTSATKTPEEAKTLADKIETMLQRSPRSAITLNELKSAAAR